MTDPIKYPCPVCGAPVDSRCRTIRTCQGTGDPGASRYDTGAADAYRQAAQQVRELLAGPA
jgi:hypothetical protein